MVILGRIGPIALLFLTRVKKLVPLLLLTKGESEVGIAFFISLVLVDLLVLVFIIFNALGLGPLGVHGVELATPGLLL